MLTRTSSKAEPNAFPAIVPAIHSGNRLALATSSLPSTRFQGSKRKIAPWIWEHLKDQPFESVLDAFGGSASMSYLFKLKGKHVTFNDRLRWNYLVGIALVENDSTRLSEDEIEELASPTKKDSAGFVTQTFSGLYFTSPENRWLDATMARISRMFGKSRGQRYKKALAHYALFQSCLSKRPFNLFHRANLSMRFADVPRSFGNRTTWDRPFSAHFAHFAREAGRFVVRGARRCRAINCDAASISPNDFDLLYLDPPYLKRGRTNETADYLHCYHFLEGLARYSEWPRLVDYKTRLRSITSIKMGSWTDPDENTSLLGQLTDKFGHSIVAISYKKYGSPSIDTLVRLLKRRGRSVTVRTRHYKYALNRQNGFAERNRECLIIASP